MKFLITGIHGFCGAHLANLCLNSGHEVFGLVRQTNGMESDILDVVSRDNFDKIKFVIGDLNDRESLYKIFFNNDFDGCFALAAMSHPPQSFIDPIGTMNTNVLGMTNLIDVIEKLQPNCILNFMSTSEVYGNSGADGRLLKESDKLEPCNPYACSKAATDVYLQERFMNKKIKGFITRAFSYTGPRRGKSFSISSDAYQIAIFINNYNYSFKREPIYKLKVGNLETVRTVIDVRDVCRALICLMENKNSNGKIFNICGSDLYKHKMKFFTDKLIELSGLTNIEKVIDEKLYRPIDILHQAGNTNELFQLTGWSPIYKIEDTLQDLLNYWVKKQL